jgi:hypothetical protein
MIHVARGRQPQLFLEHGAFALAFFGARFLFIGAVRDYAFNFTANSVVSNQGPLLIPHGHAAAGQYYQTQPAAQQASEDPPGGP